MRAHGRWPYVDLVLVKDYEQSPTRNNKAQYFFRIHMDIEVEEGDIVDIEKSLKDSNHKAIFDKLWQSHGVDADPRGLATLKAALGA
jgi:hypothetical protein